MMGSSMVSLYSRATADPNKETHMNKPILSSIIVLKLKNGLLPNKNSKIFLMPLVNFRTNLKAITWLFDSPSLKAYASDVLKA